MCCDWCNTCPYQLTTVFLWIFHIKFHAIHYSCFLATTILDDVLMNVYCQIGRPVSVGDSAESMCRRFVECRISQFQRSRNSVFNGDANQKTKNASIATMTRCNSNKPFQHIDICQWFGRRCDFCAKNRLNSDLNNNEDVHHASKYSISSCPCVKYMPFVPAAG